jgi:hypothetical protein
MFRMPRELAMARADAGSGTLTLCLPALPAPARPLAEKLGYNSDLPLPPTHRHTPPPHHYIRLKQNFPRLILD